MMRLTLVGARNGRQVVHWPGVVTASAVVVVAVTTGVLLGCFLLGRSFFLLPQALTMSIPTALVIAIWVNIRRGLRKPPDQLPPLA